MHRSGIFCSLAFLGPFPEYCGTIKASLVPRGRSLIHHTDIILAHEQDALQLMWKLPLKYEHTKGLMEPAVDLQDFMQLEVELLHPLGGLLLQSSWTHSVLWSTYLLKLDVGLRQLTLAAYAFSKQDSVASQVKFNGDFLSESEQAKYNRYYYFVFLNIPFPPSRHGIFSALGMDSECADLCQGHHLKFRLNISKFCWDMIPLLFGSYAISFSWLWRMNTLKKQKIH